MLWSGGNPVAELRPQTLTLPERFFLASEVGHGHGDYWDAVERRTPFVRRAQLDAWFAQVQSRAGSRRNRDIPPMFAPRQCLIDLVMDGLLRSTQAEALAKEMATKPPGNIATSLEI